MTSIFAWIDIALGALIAAVYLIELTAGRGKRAMADPSRRANAWQLLCVGLLTLVVGVTASWLGKNNVIEWMARVATFVIVVFMLITELRSRRARQASQPD
jgi:protein-S-isoprenylcysteine O-methyltransferase Ste14